LRVPRLLSLNAVNQQSAPLRNADSGRGFAPDAKAVFFYQHVTQGGGVRKGETTLLKGINLSVMPGEVVAIIGPSGSGKSRLIRLINQLEELTFGDILIDGKSTRQLPRQALRNTLPSLLGIFISLLKDTSLAFIVNVPELTTVAGQVNNRVQIYPAAIFVFTGVVYYLLCCGVEQLAKRWQLNRPAL